MITVTRSAVERLKTLLVEHPEDQVVRITLNDLGDHHLTFGLTLEEAVQPGDEIQLVEGITIATEAQSAPRMDGMTVDYREPDGFRFRHPATPNELTLLPSSLN
ncbi:MAG: iron-sulfur cluster biosynthesis family protein [Nitrospiraceae bacterium]